MRSSRWGRLARPTAAAVVALILSGRPAWAQESLTALTHHRIVLAGRVLSYEARAGFIPIRDNETGRVHGRMFFVAYTVDPGPKAPARPLTFLWNGGPGSNSVLVHLVGFGPRRIRSGDDPATSPPVEPIIQDNPSTWLDVTDLVFVDPIGTGFSRPTRAEFASEFYGTLEDIASVAEFIRVYRTRYDTFDQPLFLAGESYGVWRAAGVAASLEKRGTRVAGVMLLSGGMGMGSVAPAAMRTALFVPSRTAAAFYHHELSADLQRDLAATLRQAEAWATDTYAPALGRLDHLSATEREKIVSDLARFTGVDPGDIDRRTLAMSSPEFRKALLKDRGLELGRYDMRLTSQAPPPAPAVVVGRYLRHELGFETDLAYQGLETGYSPDGEAPSVGERWSWDQGTPGAAPANAGSGDGPPGGSQPWLRRAMETDSSLRAFVAAGLYDSLNSCAENRWVAAHVAREIGRRVTAACYGGGHMMYEVSEVRRRLHEDVAAFVRGATDGSEAAAGR